jgi:hypothetical protein
MTFTGETRGSDLPQVDLIWQGTSDAAEPFQSIASTHWELVVARLPGRPVAVTVRGPETRVTMADLTAGGEWWGIRFALGSFLPHLPATSLVDNGIELLEPGSRSIGWPGGRFPLPGLDDAEDFVRRLLRDDLIAYDPWVAGVLRDDPVPDRSRRTWQRRIVRATGLAPGTIRQIHRADRALELLRAGRSILDTVHEAGYYDQPHLTHSLKRWVGLTPAQVAGLAEPQLSR